MIELSFTDFHLIEILSQSSTTSIALYDSPTGLVKGYQILDQELFVALLPYLIHWNVQGFFQCNHLFLFFPYVEGITFDELFIDHPSFQKRVTLLQELILKIAQANLYFDLQVMICDKSNLIYTNRWHLYQNLKLERLLRKPKHDLSDWSTMILEALETSQEVSQQRDIPTSYQTFKEHLKQPITDMNDYLNELEQVKFAFQDIPENPHRWKTILRRFIILLIIIMLFCSIFLIYYEYQKQRQAYFQEITRIGDVKVHSNE